MKFLRTYRHRFYPPLKREPNLACTCVCCPYKWDLSERSNAFHYERKDLYCKDFAAGLPN